MLIITVMTINKITITIINCRWWLDNNDEHRSQVAKQIHWKAKNWLPKSLWRSEIYYKWNHFRKIEISNCKKYWLICQWKWGGKEGQHNKNKRRMAIERGLKRKINLLLKLVTLSTISLIWLFWLIFQDDLRFNEIFN